MPPDAALVATVLRRVHGDDPRHVAGGGEPARRLGHEPVVGVHQVDLVELGAAVHSSSLRRSTQARKPSRSCIGNSGMRHAMHDDAGRCLAGGGEAAAAAGQDPHLGALAREVLGQPRDVAGQPALRRRAGTPRRRRGRGGRSSDRERIARSSKPR